MRRACAELGMVLCLALTCSLLGLGVGHSASGISLAGAQDTTMEVGSAELLLGESASVDIWVRNFPDDGFGLGCYTVEVGYDPSMVEVTGVSPGDAPFDAPIPNIEVDCVGITQFCAVMPGPTGDVRIADLDFNCLGEGETTLVLAIKTLANTDGDGIAATPVNGTIVQSATTVSIDALANVAECMGFVARLNINNVVGLDSYQFDLSYDPAVIEVVGAEGGVEGVTAGEIDSTTVPVDMWNFQPPGTPGTMRILGNLPGIAGATGSGYVCDIHFHAIGGPGNSSDLKFNHADTEWLEPPGLFQSDASEILPVTWVDGSVHVVEFADWDVNQDKSIGLGDLVLVGQHWLETGPDGWIREDVNGDGQVSLADLVLVGQHWGEGC